MPDRSERDAEFLEHILEAIARIRRYTADIDAASFEQDQLVQDAVLRNLEAIGEAARNVMRVAPEFVARHHDVPWNDVYLMRNRLSHGYFSVDIAVVWKVVERDLSDLEAAIAAIQRNEP